MTDAAMRHDTRFAAFFSRWCPRRLLIVAEPSAAQDSGIGHQHFSNQQAVAWVVTGRVAGAEFGADKPEISTASTADLDAKYSRSSQMPKHNRNMAVYDTINVAAQRACSITLQLL